MKRLGEDFETVSKQAMALAREGFQVFFNTLGEGRLFPVFDPVDKHVVSWQRRIPPFFMEEANKEEVDDLFKYLEKDMIQIEILQLNEFRIVHSPKGSSFQKKS